MFVSLFNVWLNRRRLDFYSVLQCVVLGEEIYVESPYIWTDIVYVEYIYVESPASHTYVLGEKGVF